MRTSVFALGFLVLGLAQCGGERGLFVGDERDPDAGAGGEPGENGGTENRGGSESSGGSASRGGSGAEAGEPSSGGSVSRGGSGAEAGEPSSGGSESSGGVSGLGGSESSGGSESGGGSGLGGSESSGGVSGLGGSESSGGASGSAGSSNAGAGGTSDVDCNTLGREYIERLALAQQCSPILTVEQCTIEMPDDFFCPCPTYVNPAREGDIRRMNQILESARRCQRDCPAIACPAVKRGTCSADAIVASDGRCVGVL